MGIGSGSPALAAEETLDGWLLYLLPLLSLKDYSVLAGRGSSVPVSILHLGRVPKMAGRSSVNTCASAKAGMHHIYRVVGMPLQYLHTLVLGVLRAWSVNGRELDFDVSVGLGSPGRTPYISHGR